MAETKDILSTFSEGLIARIKSSLDQNKRNASGRTSRSLRHETSDTGTQVIGAASIVFLEHGRGRTTSTVKDGDGLAAKIRGWIKAKPVPLFRMENGQMMSINSMAFLIARKIHREGFKGTANLLTQTIERRYLDELKELIGAKYQKEIFIAATNAFKKN